MPNSAHSRPPSIAPAVLASTTVALGVLGVSLLVAGTATPTARPLLNWGTALCVVAASIGILTTLRCMIDDAVDRCVSRLHIALQAEVEEAVSSTAVRVGQAIAESLAEAENDDPRPAQARAGVSQLY